jgi:hypothetical protein
MEDHQKLVNKKSVGSTQLVSVESSPTTATAKDQGVDGKSMDGSDVLSGSKSSRSTGSESKDDKPKPPDAIADKSGTDSGLAEQVPDNQPATGDAERGPFDFGGLPNRNLKKNLGCG